MTQCLRWIDFGIDECLCFGVIKHPPHTHTHIVFHHSKHVCYCCRLRKAGLILHVWKGGGENVWEQVCWTHGGWPTSPKPLLRMTSTVCFQCGPRRLVEPWEVGCLGQRNRAVCMCFDVFVPGLLLYDELIVFLLLTDLNEIYVTCNSAAEWANAFSMGLFVDG